MKKFTAFFAGTMFLAVVLSLTAFKPLPPGPSANGQGSLTLGLESRRFAFHANTMPDGTVQGSGVLTYTTGDLKITFDIDCMKVSGQTATMSGTVTRSDGSLPSVFVPGSKIFFRVIDNGEGANDSPDQMSLLYLTGIGCNSLFNPPVSPIEGGNIQVKP
ncbi:MAG: hypothetical protein H7211_10105 [Aquabacterium sp.]|nr:hypothetical protein [Ferruginibacter sp.]